MRNDSTATEDKNPHTDTSTPAPDPDGAHPFGTVSISKGRGAYEEAARLLLQPGDATAALTLIATARAGLDSLTEAAVLTARQKNVSWGEIAPALGLSRQSVHARYRAHEGDPRQVADPMAAPPAQLEVSTLLEVPFGGPADSCEGTSYQRYPVEVYRLAGGERIAIVGDVYANTSLMNASERIMATVQRLAPGAHVLELWRHGSLSGTPGKKGRYAWSSGTGGNLPADLDQLARLGLELRDLK